MMTLLYRIQLQKLFNILVYLMPDHLHLFIELEDESLNFLDLIHFIKKNFI